MVSFICTEQCQELALDAKNRLAAAQWKNLSSEEKKKYEEVAKRYKHPDVSQLSQDEKRKLVDRHRTQLLAEVSNLTFFFLLSLI